MLWIAKQKIASLILLWALGSPHFTSRTNVFPNGEPLGATLLSHSIARSSHLSHILDFSAM